MTSGTKTTTAQRIATTQAEPHPEGVRTQTWLSTRSRNGVGWGWLGEDFSEVLQNWAIFQFSPLNSVFGSVGTVLSKGDIRDFPRTHIMNCDDLYLVMFDAGGQGMTWWAIMCIVFGFIFAKWRSGGVWSTSIERRAKHSKPTRRLTYQPQRKRSPPENLPTRFLSIIWVV